MGNDLMKKNINVVGAIIIKEGKVFCCQRGLEKSLPGKWEFPGGTLEEGETPEQCLKRELLEELAVITEIGDLICTSEYIYTPDWVIRLLVYKTTVVSGSFNLNAHDEIRWVRPADLAAYDFPEADRPIVEKLIREGCR